MFAIWSLCGASIFFLCVFSSVTMRKGEEVEGKRLKCLQFKLQILCWWLVYSLQIYSCDSTQETPLLTVKNWKNNLSIKLVLFFSKWNILASQFKAKIRQFKIKDYLRMEYFIHPMINDFAFKLSFSYGKKEREKKNKSQKVCTDL